MVKNPCVSERPYKLAVRIFEYFLPGTSNGENVFVRDEGTVVDQKNSPRLAPPLALVL